MRQNWFSQLRFLYSTREQVPCPASYTSADDVALSALAAARRVAAPLLQQSIDTSWPPGPQQQTRRSGVRRPVTGQTDRQTDGRTAVA